MLGDSSHKKNGLVAFYLEIPSFLALCIYRINMHVYVCNVIPCASAGQLL